MSPLAVAAAGSICYLLHVYGGEQAWTPSLYLKSFDMDSVQVGKAVSGKGIYTTLGIERL